MDLDEAVLYRMAYGLASALAEANENRLAGRYASNRAAGGALEVILAEVMVRLDTGQGVDPGVVRDAVEDATAGRRPKW